MVGRLSGHEVKTVVRYKTPSTPCDEENLQSIFQRLILLIAYVAVNLACRHH